MSAVMSPQLLLFDDDERGRKAREDALRVLRGQCRHCAKVKPLRLRGLCRACYDTPEIRRRYDSVAAHGNRSSDEDQRVDPAPLPDQTTGFPPGSEGKIRTMIQRRRLRQQLFHPFDSRGEDDLD